MLKSSAYPPLDGLVDLACRDGVDIRPTLLRVLTDLYVQKPTHSAEEETQYVELALGLIDAVDAATRATVAARLAALSGGAGRPCSAGSRRGTPPRRRASRRSRASRPSPRRTRTWPTCSSRPAPSERRLILINLDAGRAGPRAAGAGLQRSDPPPGERGAAAQRGRICPHPRTRARHRAAHGRANRARSFRRADRGRGQGARHEGRRAPAHLAVSQSGDRAIGRARSTNSPGFMTRSRSPPPSACWRSGGKAGARGRRGSIRAATL